MAKGAVETGHQPEKSKVVNLKRHYSEYLGFKMKHSAREISMSFGLT